MKFLILCLLIISITGQNSFSQTTVSQSTGLTNDLPLILTPTQSREDLPLVFFISGDGGWTKFDQEICDELAAEGMPVVGLNARKYFWKEKLPEATAKEFAQTINYYLNLWGKKSFLFMGYSFGACIAPYVANNFPDKFKLLLKGVYCFSPDLTGDFEIHISDMLSINTVRKYDVISELLKIKELNPTCVFGDEEELNTRNKFSAAGIKIRTLPGDHHYNKNSKVVAETILDDFK